MRVVLVWLTLGVVANGFLPSAPFVSSKKETSSSSSSILPDDMTPDKSALSIPVSTATSHRQSALFEGGKLWDRLQIEEDDEPMWYLLNCVAGLELDLLRQCRQRCEGMEDVVKFVVPTEKKTRSHGANRMVTETKVKYLGYVFAKLRLCSQTYEAIQELDLCRSWMGTVNHAGYKKLPPVPVALNYDEIESFGLEEWEDEEEEEKELTEDGIILDSAEQSERDRKKALIDEEALKAYEGFKVEDMIKVTAKNKFHNEDGIVKRLKDGMLKIRFFTYGTTFDEWLKPSDVRKLTAEEVEQGLGGPSVPITQRDFDGPQQNDRYGDNRRNMVDRFGGGPRNRRQDRATQGYGRGSEGERVQNDKNWNWYQENKRRERTSQNRYIELEGDTEIEIEGASNNDNWQEDDVDSQWGRPNSRASQRQNRRMKKDNQQDDWSAFVSPSAGPKKQVSKEETDDFFSSLMSDLSKDLGSSKSDSTGSSNADFTEEDDFFDSLMSDIEEDSSTSRSKAATTGEDDFFATLEADLDSTLSQSIEDSSVTSTSESDDDFFASLEAEIRSSKKKSTEATTPKNQKSSEEDFFASLDTNNPALLEEDPDDFFASLDASLDAELGSSDFDSSFEEIVPDSSDKASKSKTDSAASSPSAPSDLSKCTVPALKEMLKERGLKVSGKKAELIERLSEVI